LANRFTPEARKVISESSNEALHLNQNYIGTEHLLLSLVQSPAGKYLIDATTHAPISLETAREDVKNIVGEGEKKPTGEIKLTPRAKKVIELSVEEMRRVRLSKITPEVILLGLIREGTGMGAGVLEHHGINLEKLEQTVRSGIINSNK